jgi:hypothetical protein
VNRWECLKVDVGWGNNADHVWRINDVELPNWKKGPSPSEYVNTLGAEGWELVSDASHGVSSVAVLWFKRPRT